MRTDSALQIWVRSSLAERAVSRLSAPTPLHYYERGESRDKHEKAQDRHRYERALYAIHPIHGQPLLCLMFAGGGGRDNNVCESGPHKSASLSPPKGISVSQFPVQVVLTARQLFR
jgi:hypothetical protein